MSLRQAATLRAGCSVERCPGTKTSGPVHRAGCIKRSLKRVGAIRHRQSGSSTPAASDQQATEAEERERGGLGDYRATRRGEHIALFELQRGYRNA